MKTIYFKHNEPWRSIMRYNKPLPPVRYFISLAEDSIFPATCNEIINNATYWGFPKTVIAFLKQFPPEELFESRGDFETRCEELEIFINQEKKMPKEYLKSSED